jgi:DNA-binding response OmpR family regulator
MRCFYRLTRRHTGAASASGLPAATSNCAWFAAKELQVLRYLIDPRGEVFSRERLLRMVWRLQPFMPPARSIRNIAWLRQKMEKNPQSPRHILTVRGEGYRFEP